MSADCAGRDDNPVEVVLGDALPYLRHAILRAGEHELLRVNDSRQAGRVLDHGRHVDHARDVGPAAADKDADPRFLPGHVPLRRGLLEPHKRAPSRAEQFRGSGSSRAAVHHGLGDVPGSLEPARDEHPGTRALVRTDKSRLGKPVRTQLDSQAVGKLTGSGGRLHADREDHKVKTLLRDLARRPIRRRLMPVADNQVAGHRVFPDR